MVANSVVVIIIIARVSSGVQHQHSLGVMWSLYLLTHNGTVCDFVHTSQATEIGLTLQKLRRADLPQC